FEVSATTCRPRSLRRAFAKSWVCIRVLSATTTLTKSEPIPSWDGIGPPDIQLYEPEGGIRKTLRSSIPWPRGKRRKLRQRNRPQSLYYSRECTTKLTN